VEDSLSTLSKVSDELAASSGHCDRGGARSGFFGKATVGPRRCRGIAKQNSMKIKTKIVDLEKVSARELTGVANEGTWPGIDSRFRLIIVAGLRTKQLLHGSTPRIEVDPKRRRNTSIAVEEVKRGLIHFARVNKDGSPMEIVAEVE